MGVHAEINLLMRKASKRTRGTETETERNKEREREKE